jgi:hypothetical protein
MALIKQKGGMLWSTFPKHDWLVIATRAEAKRHQAIILNCSWVKVVKIGLSLYCEDKDSKTYWGVTCGLWKKEKDKNDSNFFFSVLRLKPRTSCMPGKHSTTELYPEPQYFWFEQQKEWVRMNRGASLGGQGGKTRVLFRTCWSWDTSLAFKQS